MTKNATEICEGILHEMRRENIKGNCSRSEVAVIDRMLARRAELEDAYEDVAGTLRTWQAQRTFFQALFDVAVSWTPEKMREARAERDALAQVNLDIAAKAAELVSLLELRDELCNRGGFICDTEHHIGSLIAAAAGATHNHLFLGSVREPLEGLQVQFGFKYWPRLADVIAELGRDAERAEVQPFDPMTQAGTARNRPSKADFFRALFARLDEDTCFLPHKFRPKDRTVADLGNVVLDLPPDGLADANAVKQIRHRG